MGMSQRQRHVLELRAGPKAAESLDPETTGSRRRRQPFGYFKMNRYHLACLVIFAVFLAFIVTVTLRRGPYATKLKGRYALPRTPPQPTHSPTHSPTRLISPPIIYVSGEGNMGLGNLLYQLCFAFKCSVAYGYRVVIDDSAPMFSTTRHLGQRKKRNGRPYLQSIFKHWSRGRVPTEIPVISINSRVGPDVLARIELREDFRLKGWCQHYENVAPVLKAFVKQLDWEVNDTSWLRVVQKYGDPAGAAILTARCDTDKKHAWQASHYDDALKLLDPHDKLRLRWVSDLECKIPLRRPTENVSELDLVQMLYSSRSKHLVLTDSTFHIWIGYLAYVASPDA